MARSIIVAVPRKTYRASRLEQMRPAPDQTDEEQIRSSIGIRLARRLNIQRHQTIEKNVITYNQETRIWCVIFPSSRAKQDQEEGKFCGLSAILFPCMIK